MKLEVIDGKAKIMVQTRRLSDSLEQDITMNGHQFEVVREFSYLGYKIS